MGGPPMPSIKGCVMGAPPMPVLVRCTLVCHRVGTNAYSAGVFLCQCIA